MKIDTLDVKNKRYHFFLTRRLRQSRDENGRLYRISWGLLLILMIAGITVMDYLAGNDIHLYILFLIPIVLSVWKVGIRTGICFVVICTAIELWLDLNLSDNSPIPYVWLNALARCIVYLLSAYSSWKILVMSNALADFSLIDPLTGLNNRRAFLLRGKEELVRMKRNQQPISVIFIDLDNFKTINDTLGHDVGDEALRITANLIKNFLRETDFCARLGGDEFSAILPETTGAGSLELTLKVQDALRKSFASKNFPISASIGIATFSQAPDSFEAVLKCADSLMYEVKNSTKNNVLQRNITI